LMICIIPSLNKHWKRFWGRGGSNERA
jgi:hypothetical protein